jgi:hypothetical protein
MARMSADDRLAVTTGVDQLVSPTEKAMFKWNAATCFSAQHGFTLLARAKISHITVIRSRGAPTALRTGLLQHRLLTVRPPAN